jgi:hypothetical protein
VTRIPYIWLPLTFFYFFFIMNLPALDSRGLFFFSAGVWLQKRNFSVERQPAWFSLGLTIILFVGTSVIKTFMAFELGDFDPWTGTEFTAVGLVLITLHQTAVVTGILAMWFGSDRVIQWFFRQPWFNHASGFSFFMFGMHVPLLPYMMTFAMSNLAFLPSYRLLCYLLVPLLVLVFCIWVGSVCRKYLPSFYGLLTGGRGF